MARPRLLKTQSGWRQLAAFFDERKDGIRWKKYKDLPYNWQLPPEKTGVYWIRVKDREFVRANGQVDTQAILYIGSSVNLRQRIHQFWTGYHIAGWTYFDPRFGFEKKFPRNKLLVKWHVGNKHQSSRNRELQELLWYLKDFQDKPPLNFQIKRD